MGRIKTQQIKAAGHALVKSNKDEIKPTFEENKEVAGRLADIKSKKIRNALAGYLTRLYKKLD